MNEELNTPEPVKTKRKRRTKAEMEAAQAEVPTEKKPRVSKKAARKPAKKTAKKSRKQAKLAKPEKRAKKTPWTELRSAFAKVGRYEVARTKAAFVELGMRIASAARILWTGSAKKK